MNDSKKYISTQIERTIPQFVRMEYPNFVKFIVSYYEWLEQEGKPYHFLANILNFMDVDETSLEFLEEFAKNFLAPLPNIIYDQNNLENLVKNIEQYYSARGSEKAFEFLFRLFEYKDNDEKTVDIYYPSADMLRVSDGKWEDDNSIKIIGPISPDGGDSDYEFRIKELALAQWKSDVEGWKSGNIVGDTSGAKSVIDRVKIYESTSGVNVAEIFLIEYDVIHKVGDFTLGETITITNINGNIFSAVIEPVLYNITITNAGKYYHPKERLTITTTGDGENAVVVIKDTSKGVIESLTIFDGGLDYNVNDVIRFESVGFGSNANGVVTSVDGSGTITGVKLLSYGNGYDNMPKLVVDSSTGSGSIIMPESSSIGNIKSIEIRDFGINYNELNMTLNFNTVLRLFENTIDFSVGEEVDNGGGATGIVEYIEEKGNTISIRMTSGTPFAAGDLITGSWNGGTANVYDTSTATADPFDGCLCIYDGRYINNDGHISSTKYIQDSYFYQLFSYMIKTHQPKSEWGDYVKNIHPAGAISFSYNEIDGLYKELLVEPKDYIGPKLDTLEFYKFFWGLNDYHGGHETRLRNNTEIKQYGDFLIDQVSNINITILDRSNLTFGSEITIG